MVVPDEEPEADGPTGQLPAGAEHVDADMPCVRCGYNLRGLADEGTCPECGAAVEETLDFVFARVLCPACLAPNHPSASICERCKSPISGAAAMANYYRTSFVHGPKVWEGREEEEPEPPSKAAMGVGWAAGLFLLVALAVKLAAEFLSDTGDLASGEASGQAWALLLAAVVLVPVFIAIIYVPTRGYRKRKARYETDIATFREKPPAAEPGPGE